MNIYEVLDPIAGKSFLSTINVWSILIRIVIVLILSSLLGVERSQKRHAAGLRTFILTSLFAVCGGLVDTFLMNNYNISIPVVSASIVIGIAIISANTMLYSSKSQIKGLTTAVALWSSTFIGLTIGFGLYTVGLIGFIVLLLSLNSLPYIEFFLKNRSNHFEIHLELKNKTDLPVFLDVTRQLGLRIDDIEMNPAYANSGVAAYSISITITSEMLKKYKTHEQIIEALSKLDCIVAIEENM